MQVATRSAPAPGDPRTPALVLPGTYLFKRHDVILRSKQATTTERPYEYLLELIAASLDPDEPWLYNDMSIACAFQRNGKLASNCHARARDLVRELKPTLGHELEAGGLRYRLAPSLGLAEVSPRVLANPYLHARILNKLRAAMERHRLPTQ